MINPSVEVKSITKHFRIKEQIIKAVDGVSFSCEKGKIFGLLGPNGAGKTTILRILATLLKPTGGSIFINGVDSVRNPIKARQGMSYMSEETKLYERLTVYEMLSYVADVYNVQRNEIELRVDKYLSEFGISDFKHVSIAKLSSGMKQKINIIRCIIHEPSVVILDEPTSNLDVVASQVIVNSLKILKDSNKCVVVSSHNMLQAQKICDSFCIINKGLVVEQGDLEGILERNKSADLEEAFLKSVGEYV